MTETGETNSTTNYRTVAEAYTAGARALFTAGLPPTATERAAVDFSAGDIAAQGSRLAPISERFTQTAADLLADPDPQVRADASAQMLAKALVDLQISAYFLQAADAENPAAQSFGLEESFRSERSAAMLDVEDALAVILVEPGKGALPVERGLAAEQAFGVAIPTHVPAARKQVSQMAVDMLEQIETRAGKTAQSAMGGLFAIGIGQVTQAAGLVGLNVAQAIGVGEKVSQLYNLVREFFVNAYNTILTLVGPALVKTATTQVVSWVHGAVQGKQFIAAVNTIYGTGKTKTELRALVENSQAQLDNYIAALNGLDQLNQQYGKQMGLVEKVIQVLRFVPSIPLAAVPQARLLLGATYIVLTGYVIFAGADYVDAPRFNKLDRIPGPRKIINKHLYPEQGSEGGASDGGDGGPGKEPTPEKPPAGGGQKAEPPEEKPQSAPKPQAPPMPPAPEPQAPPASEEPQAVGSEPPEELAESAPTDETAEAQVEESTPAPPPSFGDVDFSIPAPQPPPPAPSMPPPSYARDSEPPAAAPEEDLLEEAIRLDVAVPKTPVVVGVAFEIAVAIRQPQSSRLAVDGLEAVTSADGLVYRRAERDLVRYKVIVSAPSCKVETPEQSFMLRAGRDSEARFFLLTPLSAGTQTVVVTAYQEDDLVVAQTRVRLEVSIQAVAPEATPSREALRDLLLKELTERGVMLPTSPIATAPARGGSFAFENLDVELFDYTADEDENERFKVRVECALAGEQSIADADEVTVPPGLRRSLNLLKRRGLQPEELVELGRQLGQMLFPPTARWYYEQSRARLREGEALRIRIKTDDYPLATIAWEYAYLTPHDAPPTYSGPDGFLTLDRRVSLVRYEVLGQPVASLEPMDGAQLVMLMMLANSSEPEIPRLNLNQEKKNIVKALEKNTQIELKSFANVDYRSLQDALDTRAHIFHFAGHGMFQGDLGPLRSTVGEGFLLLKGKTPREAFFPASKLALNLRDSGVRLAVLGVCEGGERDPVNAWTGIAPALARAGIPAVVAMQFKVYDHAAIAFHRSFYRALAAGEPVDTAVANGRRAVFNLPDGDRDWGTPVLYLRAEDGVLFPRPAAPAFGGLAFSTPAAPDALPAPLAALAPPQDPRQMRVYEALSGYAFSIDDLEETCFRLGVDWDSLEHDTKPVAAREMVLYFTRRGDLDRLYQYVKAERPTLNLP